MGAQLAKAAVEVGGEVIGVVGKSIENTIGGVFGGGNSFLAAAPNQEPNVSGGGRNWSGLSTHFAEDVEAMDHASQQGTVSPDEWHSFYTCLYRLVTTVHDPGHDQGLTSAIHDLTQALHGTENDEFASEDAINAAHKFLQGHIGLHILAFLSIIDEDTGLDFSADPEVEETLKTGNEILSQAEDQLEEQNDGHDHGQWHDEEEHEEPGYDQGEYDPNDPATQHEAIAMY